MCGHPPGIIPDLFAKPFPHVRPVKQQPLTIFSRGRWSLNGERAVLLGRRRRNAAAGFTLVELMVVVLIISVLATISVPALQRIQRKTKSATIFNDFRVFGAAFDTYAQEFGSWPADTAAGVFPAGMDQRINQTEWLRKTPMGGQYNWEYNQNHFGVVYRAAISISTTASAPLPLDVPQLIDLEQTIDGIPLNFLGGQFHIGTGLVPLYIIQP